MKALCPVCNIEGFLEQRGANARIKHYMGFANGKRKYVYHSIAGNQLLGINVPDLSPKDEKMAGGEGFEPSTPNLGGWCSIRTELLAQKFPFSTSVSWLGVITLTFKQAGTVNSRLYSWPIIGC